MQVNWILHNVLFFLLLPLINSKRTSPADLEMKDYQRSHPLGRSTSTDPPYTQKLFEWLYLKYSVWLSATDAPDDPCSVNEALTHAYFLLGDLIDFHRVTGILNHAYPRLTFYDAAFKDLHSAVQEVGPEDKRTRVHPEIIFCTYDNRLVCLNSRCVSCDSPKVKGHLLLEKGCGYTGNAGNDAPVDEEKIKELLPLQHLTSDPQTGDPKYCDDGWLYTELVWAMRKVYASGELGQGRLDRCGYSSEVQLALAHLTTLTLKGSAVGTEVDKHRQFYEDKLRVLRNWKVKSDGLWCSYGVEENGPWVCGKDGLCLRCSSVTAEVGDLWGACHLGEVPMEYKKECGRRGMEPKKVKTDDNDDDAGVGGGRKVVGWGVWGWIVVGGAVVVFQDGLLKM